jgi:hypothetical protein
MMTARIVRLIASMLVAGLALSLQTGCSKVAEESTEAAVDGQSGSKVSADPNGGTAEAKDDQASESGLDKLPKDFPADVPVGGGIKIVSSSSAPDTGGGTGYTLKFYHPEAPHQAGEAYQKDLMKQGWRITMQTTRDGSVFLSAEKGELSASVTIRGDESKDDFKSLVSVVVVPLME